MCPPLRQVFCFFASLANVWFKKSLFQSIKPIDQGLNTAREKGWISLYPHTAHRLSGAVCDVVYIHQVKQK